MGATWSCQGVLMIARLLSELGLSAERYADKIAAFRRAVDAFRDNPSRSSAPPHTPPPAQQRDPGRVHEEREANIAWNKEVWGKGWEKNWKYDYKWGGSAFQQVNSSVTPVAERFLHPYLDGNRDLKILEIAPGGGRFTAELIRLSRDIHLLDINQACLDICRDRFQYYPSVHTYLGAGSDLDNVPDADFDLVASFDSMVHMSLPVVTGYVTSAVTKVRSGGLIWIDTSGKGATESGNRTDVHADDIAALAKKLDLTILDQSFRNDWDVVSVLRKP